jgi:hypothetical protein
MMVTMRTDKLKCLCNIGKGWNSPAIVHFFFLFVCSPMANQIHLLYHDKHALVKEVLLEFRRYPTNIWPIT